MEMTTTKTRTANQRTVFSGGNTTSSTLSSLPSSSSSSTSSSVLVPGSLGSAIDMIPSGTETSRTNHSRLETINNNNTGDDNKPLQNGCIDIWCWSKKYRSPEVVLSGISMRTAFFHPNWSKGTAGVRGTKVLNNGRYYWEIHVTNRIFGTRLVLIY